MARRHDMREFILSAADKRVARLGYDKTTVAGIAQDCGVSPSHIYNFFPTKLDLVAELVRREGAAVAAVMAKAARQRDASCAERLRAVVMRELRETHRRYTMKPGMLAIIRRLSQDRPDAADLAPRRAVFAALLAEARESDEFAVADPERTADAVLAATAKFRNPEIAEEPAIRRLSRAAEDVVHLILDGLRTR